MPFVEPEVTERLERALDIVVSHFDGLSFDTYLQDVDKWPVDHLKVQLANAQRGRRRGTKCSASLQAELILLRDYYERVKLMLALMGGVSEFTVNQFLCVQVLFHHCFRIFLRPSLTYMTVDSVKNLRKLNQHLTDSVLLAYLPQKFLVSLFLHLVLQ